MATLYLRCGTGVSSFVIHSKSNSAYQKTVTATSYTAYTGFSANSKDAYISDIVYKSGYSGATIYSSTTGTEWSAGSDPYISLATYSTRYAEVRASYSPPTSYWVRCEVGYGLNSFTYLRNTTSGTGTSTTLANINVGSGGYLYLQGFSFASGYTYPVTVTTSNPSSTWTIDGPSTTAYYRQVDPPSSGGTRSVMLTATYNPQYSHAVNYYSQGSYLFADSWSDSSQTIDGRSLSGYTPTRSGYQFLGWDTSSAASHVVYSYPSNIWEDAANVSLYAVWKRLTDHAVRYYNGTTLFYTDSWSDERDYITGRSVYSGTPTRQGYIFQYWQSSSGNKYGSGYSTSITEDLSSVDLNAVFKSTAIELFQWTSNDAVKIAKDQPFSNITADKWKEMHQKILDCGHSHSYTQVFRGDTFTASLFNAAVTDISSLPGCGTLPGSKSTGNQIMASYFSANSASLKSALNAAINYHNNN